MPVKPDEGADLNSSKVLEGFVSLVVPGEQLQR